MYWRSTKNASPIGKAGASKSSWPWATCRNKSIGFGFVVLAVWAGVSGPRLSADGRVFPASAHPAAITIPDQRALICYTNRTERLVIETRFTGEGTNFAWVVPLPSEPVIEEASAGLFPTLQHLFQPRIIHDVPTYWPKFLALSGVVYLALFLRPTGRVTGLDVVAGLLLCLGLAPQEALLPGWIIFGPVIFGPLMCGVLLVRVAQKPSLAIFGYAIMTVFILMALLPVVPRPGGGSKTRDSLGQAVSILDRRLAGVYETTTLTSRDSNSLLAWLSDHGFAASTNCQPVIDSYLKDGWVFVAAKLRRGNSGPGASTPRPLSFTFKSDRAVFPTRLTGVENGPVRVELYVFGDARATASRFKVERCARPAYPQPPESWSYGLPETPQIVHPLLRRWVGGSAVATQLTATLGPAEMRGDVWIDWTPFSETKNHLFSRAGAATWALNFGSGILAAGLLVACAFAYGNLTRRRGLARLSGGVAALAWFLSAAAYFALPKTAVRLLPEPASISARNNLFYMYWWLDDENPETLAGIRANARHVLTNPENDNRWIHFARSAGWKSWANDLVGGPVREEDSPGNFSLRPAGDRLAFVVYDAQGAEHVLGDWPLRPEL